MNLNQITSGTDYAFFPSRGRGEEFRFGREDANDVWRDGTYSDRYFVYRVKAIRAYSKREIGNKRDTGYVEVFWVSDDGEFKFNSEGEYLTKTVRVRDIATLWEDYEDMRDYEQVRRDKQEIERAERAEQRRLAYEREEQERIEKRRIERERIEREQLELERKQREYTRSIEYWFKLPTGSVGLNGGNILTLDKQMIDALIERNGG